MKQSKQLFLFTLILLSFSLLECVFTAVFSPMLEKSVFLSTVLPFVFRLFAVTPPFFALGLAFAALHVRSFSYGLSFLGIYAMVALITQIPLSLLAFVSAESASYGPILFSYMLTATLTALLFLLFFLLGYALFLQGDTRDSNAVFTLACGDARAMALSASLLTLYTLIREIVDMIAYAKDKLFVLTGEDILSMAFSLLFFTALGVFCFLVGRIAGRILPTIPLEINEEDDYV